jgi:hypothetical protein
VVEEFFVDWVDENRVVDEFLVDRFGGNVYQSSAAESPLVGVKNTFIHIEEDDTSSIADSLSLPPRSISAPNVLRNQRLLTPRSASEALCSPLRRWSEDSTSEAQASELSDVDDEFSDVDEEALGDAPSVGSTFHASGTCRPCAWFWKHQGCSNGKQCRHCHLCPQGEIKRRRKTKFVAMRNEKIASAAGAEREAEATASSDAA